MNLVLHSFRNAIDSTLRMNFSEAMINLNLLNSCANSIGYFYVNLNASNSIINELG